MNGIPVEMYERMGDSLRNLTLDYDPAKGLSGPVPPDVQHLTIDSKVPVSLDAKLVSEDAQGNQVLPYYDALITDPKTTNVMAYFGMSPNLQDITIEYSDASGVHKDPNSPYSASQVRLRSDIRVISACLDDFRPPDPNLSAQGIYPITSSVYEFGYRLSDIPSSTLAFMQNQLVNQIDSDRKNGAMENPFADIALAETNVGLGVQQYQDYMGTGLVNLAEKHSAETNIQDAQAVYNSAVTASRSLMQQLPADAASLDQEPHNFYNRRFPPSNPKTYDDFAQAWGSAIDIAAGRSPMLGHLTDNFSGNGILPRRQSKECDLP